MLYILFFSHSLHPYLSPLPHTTLSLFTKSQRLLLSLSLSLSKKKTHNATEIQHPLAAMDDDWGLHAVVRGCSAAFSPATSASSAATSATTATTQTTIPFTADFQPFNIHHHSNNNSSFLSSSPSFGNIGQSGSSSSSGYGQLFSLSASSSSDLVATMMRPSSRSTGLSHGHVNAVEDLHDLYRPFFTKPERSNNISQLATAPNSSGSIVISSFSRSNNSSSDQRSVQQQQQMKHNNTLSSSNAKPLSHSAGSASATTPRSKKRKNQLKKVCQVPAESLSSDIWAWRKYGQKPIKGSPYPRGYYRCSSSKGCLARKQVERNRSDPGMFIVTYTAEHNHPAPTHRNSLAGSTRQKPSLSSASAAVSGEPANPSEPAKPSSPATSPEEDPAAAAQAQSGSATESKEGPESSTLLMDDDEDDDEFGFSDMAVSDDFFVGLEGLGAPATGEFFSDNFPAGLGLSWSASSAATAAGGS